MLKKFFVFPVLLLIAFSIKAQDTIGDQYPFFKNATERNKGRLALVHTGIGAAYTGSMSWLYSQWYKNYPMANFHFFNDNKEWLMMDKFAHCWDAYAIAKPLYRMYRWTGLDNRKAIRNAAGIAFLFQATVEVFDGFSKEWGFSNGDLIANTAGVAFFAGQQYFWNEQRIFLKFSFQKSPYAKYRPNLLGSTLPERILKDYNGMTFWMTVNPGDFTKRYNVLPKWLAFAVGFGADGMTGGSVNPTSVDGVPIPSFDRRKQYYLSLDLYLSRIQTKSRFLNSLFRLVNVVHLPFPAIEFSGNGRVKGHWLYF